MTSENSFLPHQHINISTYHLLLKFWKPAAALLFLTILYLSTFNCFYVGQFNDDARHVLAAKALLTGSYSDLYSPSSQPITNLLPGYPLLLAGPLWAGSLPLAKILSVFFTAASVFLIYFTVRGPVGFFTAALFALHPQTVTISSTLMSEPAFLFWTMGTLYIFSKIPVIPPFFVLLWTAFGAWIRPQGLLLFLVILPDCLKSAPKGKKFFTALLPACILVLPYVRNFMLSGTPASYFDELPRAAGFFNSMLSLSGTIYHNLLYYYHNIPGSLFAVQFQSGSYPWWGSLAAAAAWIALIAGFRMMWLDRDCPSASTLRGARSLTAPETGPMAFKGCRVTFKPPGAESAVEPTAARQSPDSPASTRASYFILLSCIQLFWVNQSVRYLMPVLPFILEAFIRTLVRADSRRTVAYMVAVMTAFFLFGDANAIKEALKRPLTALPAKTASWIKNNTKDQDLFMSAYRESTFLLAERKGIGYTYHPDTDRWYAGLLQKGISYVWIDRARPLMDHVPSVGEEFRSRFTEVEKRVSDASRFRPVFSDSAEAQAIYRIAPPKGFVRAYESLSAARRIIESGRFAEALDILEKLAAEKAPLRRLDFYAGTTAMLAGKKEKALLKLAGAVDAEPDYMPALRNLASVCKSLNRKTGLCGKFFREGVHTLHKAPGASGPPEGDPIR
ncbi:MAG: tetratricopeptide repeat protein [bacterium]